MRSQGSLTEGGKRTEVRKEDVVREREAGEMHSEDGGGGHDARMTGAFPGDGRGENALSPTASGRNTALQF